MILGYKLLKSNSNTNVSYKPKKDIDLINYTPTREQIIAILKFNFLKNYEAESLI